MSEETSERKFEQKGWADFLETVSPSAVFEITDMHGTSSAGSWVVREPVLQLHCSSEYCNGSRFFDATSSTVYLREGANSFFITFTCRHCRTLEKTFAIKAFLTTMSAPALAVKLGESPAFGPPTPARVISLIGPDRDIFLKGRRAENQGLGIGAFAYYRRVVENQKSRFIREIAKVAARLGVGPEQLGQFERAAAETQFSRAIDDIKGAIPQALLIDGHNPLTLLHGALSEGIHAQTDEECLEIATSIRVVMTELAERITIALKDEAELKNAVSRLLNRGKAAG